MENNIIILLVEIFIFVIMAIKTTKQELINLRKFKDKYRGFLGKNSLFKKYLEFIIYYRKLYDSVKKTFINNFFPSYFLNEILLSESLEFEGLVI